MPETKPTLSDMYEALDEIELRESIALKNARERWPDIPQRKLEARVAALKAARNLLATMEKNEDKSRDFIVGLQEEHRRG